MNSKANIGYAILLILCVPVILTVCVHADSYIAHPISGYDIEISIPDSLIYFDQDILENDSTISQWGLDQEALKTYCDSNNIYLGAVSKDGTYEILVTAEDGSTYSDYNLCTDEDILKITNNELIPSLESKGAICELPYIYTHSQTRFAVVQYTLSSDIGETSNFIYTTVHNSVVLGIAMHVSGEDFSEYNKTILRNVISTVNFKNGNGSIQTSNYSDSSSHNILYNPVGVIVSLIITYLLYSFPILLYKLCISKEIISKRKALRITIIYGIISFAIMMAIKISLKDYSANIAAVFFWGTINYLILKGKHADPGNNLPRRDIRSLQKTLLAYCSDIVEKYREYAKGENALSAISTLSEKQAIKRYKKSIKNYFDNCESNKSEEPIDYFKIALKIIVDDTYNFLENESTQSGGNSLSLEAKAYMEMYKYFLEVSRYKNYISQEQKTELIISLNKKLLAQ